MPNKEEFEGVELTKFLEKYEVKRIRDSLKERIITIVIASLGLIAALAWDDALKHLFEKLLGGLSNLTEEIIYAIIVTAIAAAVSVYLGKIYTEHKGK